MNGKIIIAVIVVVALLAAGTYQYHEMEGWSYANALYFCVVTLSTIGYAGGLHPTTDASKLFTVGYIIFGVVLALIALTSIATYVLEHKYMRAYEENMSPGSEFHERKNRIIHKIKRKILE
jgi:hypothetical protein